ncbi:Rha family transcriptional regulator [Aliarcobacter cryaerophilus]|uniref:Rha family transcriptional regulator n=1 Tax=Aliarcobacter cryaerophilus TaxID=28198 RepID=UPI0008262332|nr:Rha family transcriptional regulator [Aliarcobacter cryaerophilus]
MQNLITIVNEEMTVSHRVVAEQTANQEKSIRNTILKFIDDFKIFGTVHFKNEGIVNNGKGEQPKTYFLNEQQAYLLLTYLRNNEIVRNFKVTLVKAFFEMRERLYPKNNHNGKNINYIIGGYKSQIVQHNLSISRLQDKVQTLSSENEKLKVQIIKSEKKNLTPLDDMDDRSYTKEDIIKLIEKGLKYDELQEKYFKLDTQKVLFNTYADEFINQANKMKVEAEKWQIMQNRLENIKNNGVERCKETGWRAIN